MSLIAPDKESKIIQVIRRARTIADVAIRDDKLSEIAFREILAANRHLLTFTEKEKTA